MYTAFINSDAMELTTQVRQSETGLKYSWQMVVAEAREVIDYR